jgi:hypothetical protein
VAVPKTAVTHLGKLLYGFWAVEPKKRGPSAAPNSSKIKVPPTFSSKIKQYMNEFQKRNE